MFLVNLSIIPIFILWAGLILGFNIAGFLKRKSLLNGINLAISLILLMIHMSLRYVMPNWSFSFIWDIIFLIVSISLFLYVNDIETRRKVISEVFENRYKNRSKK